MNTDDARRLLLQQLVMQQLGGVPGASPAVADGASGARTAPASFAQRRLWFVEQLQQVQAPYTLHAVQHLRFAVDAHALESALCEIAQRHEVLRTTFELRDDEVVQCIAPQPQLQLRQIDLGAWATEQREPQAKQQMTQTLAKRFDLRTGPLLRAELYALGAQEFLLLVAVHHIVFDWQSFQVFFQCLEFLTGICPEFCDCLIELLLQTKSIGEVLIDPRNDRLEGRKILNIRQETVDDTGQFSRQHFRADRCDSL